jgi:tyrosyl-tRNA synthetase
VAGLKAQAERFFAGMEIEFVNNADWLGELRLIDFLREIGKHYTVNELIKKDAIATRLASDTGLSYTEFAYPILQGYDYLQLYETRGCTVQVGGSDQWGNIISGVELVRRKKQAEVFAITVPLVIDKTTGKKFGKSEGNAVWLDPTKTSPYQFYQFWLNIDDVSVIEYLRRFTFVSLEDIATIEHEFEQNPGTRAAQRKLAFGVTELVHGTALAHAAENVSGLLFGSATLNELTTAEQEILLENAPVSTVAETTPLVDVLVITGLAMSKREARMFIESGAVSINGEKIEAVEFIVTPLVAIAGLVVLKRGKKQIHILRF